MDWGGLADHLATVQPVPGLETVGPDGAEPPLTSVAEMACRLARCGTPRAPVARLDARSREATRMDPEGAASSRTRLRAERVGDHVR